MKLRSKIVLASVIAIPAILMIQSLVSGIQEATPSDFKIKAALPAVTIAVHPDLVRATQTLPAIYGPAQLKRLYGGSSIEAMADASGLLLLRQNHDSEWLHPFLQAAHNAFADHRPLVISPDMIWLLITQKIQRHLEYSPEIAGKLLSRNPSSQEELIVRRDKFQVKASHNDWPGVFAEFANQIQGKSADPAFSAAFSHRFSSSSVDSVAVRQITLMKTASPFYRYSTWTLCGIPEIRLEGDKADWLWIHDQLPILVKAGMAAEVPVLQEVMKEFILAAEGKAEPTFWRSFFKWEEISGGYGVTGWFNVFFRDCSDVVLKEKAGNQHSYALNAERNKSTRFPSGFVVQDFTWTLLNQNLPMRLHAGFLGVSQDPVTLALRPEILWVIEHR